MTDKALRDNAGKPELSYLLSLPRALEALVRVFEYGAKKYARDNWKKGGKPDEEYLDAALRHIFRHRNEGPVDPESGQLHLSHAAWNLLALVELNLKPEFVAGGINVAAAPWPGAKLTGLEGIDTTTNSELYAGISRETPVEFAHRAAHEILQQVTGATPRTGKLKDARRVQWLNPPPMPDYVKAALEPEEAHETLQQITGATPRKNPTRGVLKRGDRVRRGVSLGTVADVDLHDDAAYSVVWDDGVASHFRYTRAELHAL